MRKLIIQIPCFNEEETLGQTLAALPRSVSGFDTVEWLVIDDGSRDGTVKVARECGVEHIISLPHNRGLARAFMVGLEACLKAGADVIVNTDADNQYDAGAIPDLVRPILSGEALMVIGARPIMEINEFSRVKKLLQRFGSKVVKLASKTGVPDAPSGFRAIHRDAALRLCVFSDYTYTLETIIQAGRNSIPVTSVPVRVNLVRRPSRLVKSVPSYVRRSLLTIIRIFILYKPLRFFLLVGALLLTPGLLIGLRFMVSYWTDGGAGHIQSLILASVLILSAGLAFVSGVIADLIAANRVLLEDVRMRLLRAEIQGLQADLSQTAPDESSTATAPPKPGRVGEPTPVVLSSDTRT